MKVAFMAAIIMVIPACHGVFDRVCDGGHCIFKPQKSSNTKAYLSCTLDNRCACDRYTYIADVPSWKLEISDGKCQIAVSGPCGEDNGLEIECKAQHECIEGRCRDPKELRKTPLNNICYADIDCQPGLVCKVADFQYRNIYRCVTPETPEYDPSVGYPPPPRKP